MNADKPSFPNLFVIGAMKAGTTSVHHVLSEHPDIFMSSVKEPRYFEFMGDRRRYYGPSDPANNRPYANRRRYLWLFKNRGASRYAGESSTIYLYSSQAAQNIRRAVPDARIIAILRKPADRAYSNFVYGRQRALEPERSFQRALELEEERIARNWGPFWHYKRKGQYADQIERYLKLFPRNRVFVGLYDDLKSDPAAFYRRIMIFLGVSDNVGLNVNAVMNRSVHVRSSLMRSVLFQAPTLLPESVRHTIRNTGVGAFLQSGLHHMRAWGATSPEPMQRDIQHYLHDYYLQDICRLEKLLELDLSHWRENS